MPALVKSSVGSWAGTRGDDRTTVWPRRREYSRNRALISLPVIGAILYAAILLGDGEVDPGVGEQRGDGVTDRRGRIAAPQQGVGQAGGGAGRPAGGAASGG